MRHKIVIIGDENVGKTSIVNNIMHKKNVTCPTIGAMYSFYKIDDTNGIEIWDVAGSARYLSLLKIYYRKTDTIILVYDMSEIDSLDRLINIISEIEKTQIAKFIVVGNKMDLCLNVPKMNSHVKKLFKNHKVIEYINTSAKTGENIKLLLDTIIIHFSYNNDIGVETINDTEELVPKKRFFASYCTIL